MGQRRKKGKSSSDLEYRSPSERGSRRRVGVGPSRHEKTSAATCGKNFVGVIGDGPLFYSKDYYSERTPERIFAHSLSHVVIILKNLRTGGYTKVKDGKSTIQRKLLPSW
jgi:hypothetical protein